MTLDELLVQLTDSSRRITMPELISYRSTFHPTKRELRILLEGACKSIDQGNAQTAGNFLCAGLLFDEEKFLLDVRKTGLLRISRRFYSSELLTSVLESLEAVDKTLSSTATDYLMSVRNLHEIAKSIRTEFTELRDWLSSERERAIRGGLCTLEFLCLKKTFEYSPSDPSLSSRDMYFYSVEQLAAGFSMILALYFGEFGAMRGNVSIDAQAAVSGEYVDRLISAAHIAEFREWEFLVDRFDYRILRVSDAATYSILPPTFEHLRAFELGHIHDFQQRCAVANKAQDAAVPSYLDIGRDLSVRVAQFVDTPFPRYRFELPETIFTLTADLRLFFQEERKTLTWSCRELYTTVEELFQFEVSNGITFHDLFRVSRLINLMHGVSAATLQSELKERPEVVFNSLLLSFRTDSFLRMITLVVGEEKAGAIVELFSAGPSGHIDVFYTPLIPAGDCILLPVHLFSNSDFFRNLLIKTQRRLFHDGSCDPLTEHVGRIFAAAGAAVQTQLEYSWNGGNGEIDVIANLGDMLFVCECKHSLLPTGTHELRTSMDHIEKAAGQLDRIVECCRDDGFRQWLSGCLDVQVKNNTRVISAIIVSNRMLVGLRVHGHPIRASKEFDNFVSTGTVWFHDHIIRQWLGDNLVPEDVRRFFEDDVTYRPFWDSMEAIESRFELSECNVVTQRLRLNAIMLADSFGLPDLKDQLLKEVRAQGLDVDDNGKIAEIPLGDNCDLNSERTPGADGGKKIG